MSEKCPDCGTSLRQAMEMGGSPDPWSEQWCESCQKWWCETEILRRQLAQAQEENERLKAIVEPLNRLREPEGASVTILCPNPSFDGPAQAVEVWDDWGDGWRGRRFAGETLAEALAAAEAAQAATAPEGQESPK